MTNALNIVVESGIALLAALFLGGLAWHIASAASAITYVTAADGRRRERRLPLIFRALLPLTPVMANYFKKQRFKKLRERVSQSLVSGGFDDLLAPEEFLALRLMMPLVAGPFLASFAAALFALIRHFPGGQPLIFAAAIILWSAFYPGQWLKQSIALRHRQIMKALPYVIDLLTLSVEAGLDFMTSLKNIVEKRAPDAIAEEFSRMLFEIQLGKTRRHALQSMGNRIRQPDVQALVNALVQADEMGVSIGAILRIQSGEIRNKRFMRAEKLANEAPVKMLFPLVAFIFPVVFLIMLGPIVARMFQNVF
ncbi:MAG: type II secretion system F family protein [Kiritimatiellae bacterium]|nr:type II secretion system F family protein [Kiritimatiellia bacterium]